MLGWLRCADAHCQLPRPAVGSRESDLLGHSKLEFGGVRCGSTTHTLTSGRGRGWERPTHIIMYLLYTSRVGSEGWGVGMGVGFITYVLHAHTHMCVYSHIR